MNSSARSTKSFFIELFFTVSIILSTLLVVSCGNTDTASESNDSSSGTGSYSCSISWPDNTSSANNGLIHSNAVDCSDTGIDWVTFTFYDENNIQLMEEDFACDLHSGTVEKIPAGSNRRLVVTAADQNGIVYYQGEQTGIAIVEDQNTDGGEISLESVRVLHDDFSGDDLDTTLWSGTSGDWYIENNRLWLNAEGFDSTTVTWADLANSDVSYLEAKARIANASTLSLEAFGWFRVVGHYYNELRGQGSGQDYDGYLGEVQAEVRLEMDGDRTLTAWAWVSRWDDADRNSSTNHFLESFTTPISFDADYTISVEYKDSSFIFTCNGESMTYTITTTQYPPYDELRSLETWVLLDTGESGDIQASVDEVYIKK